MTGMRKRLAPVVRGTMPSETTTQADERARLGQTVLIAVTFALFVYAWWFPFNVLLDTPWIDITALEPALLIGALTVLAVRGWRSVTRSDLRWMALTTVFFTWLLATALLRGNGADVKRATAYITFTAIAMAVAFIAARLGRERAGRWLMWFFVVALGVAVASAVLEHLTYDPAPASDPLAWLWALVRPQVALDVPNVGVMRHPPLHFAFSGGAIRTTGIFGHPLYMAFFALLAAGLFAAIVMVAWRELSITRRALLMIALGAAAGLCYWTYSRAPLAGLLAIVGVVALLGVAIAYRRGHPESRRRALIPAAAVLLTVAASLTLAVTLDDALLQRFLGTANALEDVEVEPGSVAGSAAQATNVRLRLQGVAIEMLTDSPRSALAGPGLTAYELRLKSESEVVQRFTHPHSAWLTQSLLGGVVGAVLFGALLALAAWHALRSISGAPGHYSRVMLIWTAAWIPVWSLIQVFGLNPVAPGEAVIVGSMLGIAFGHAGTTRSSPCR